jgi:hypothetical protein
MGWLARSEDYGLESLREAAVIGSVLASFCVEDFGPRRLEDVTLDDVWVRYEAIREMVRFDPPGRLSRDRPNG